MVRVLVVLALVCALQPAVARAQLPPVPVDAPIAGASFDERTAPTGPGEQIVGFAAGQGQWVALVADSIQNGAFRMRMVSSADGAQTWNAVTLPDAVGPGTFVTSSGLVVGPDGAFYFSAIPVVGIINQTGGAIYRLGAGDAEARVWRPIADAGAAPSPPAWDGDGHVWVSSLRAGGVALSQLDDAGAAVRTLVGPYDRPVPGGGEVQFLPSGIWVRAGGAWYQASADALVPAAHPPPLYQEGPLMIAGGVSVDGGASFMPTGDRLMAVDGAPGLIVNGGWVLQRHSEAWFGPTALRVPEYRGISRVFVADGAFFAVSDQSRSASYNGATRFAPYLGVHAGPLPQLGFSTGALKPQFTAWLRRANEFRSQAGLTPLIGDPLISQAAENHSRYWTLNPAPKNLLDYHGETPGRPGFTGAGLDDRCTAAGGRPCMGEIMGADIDGWVATTYHRGLLISPTQLLVGGAQFNARAPEVMDSADQAGLLTGPVMFPRGRYDGPLAFSGEAPDPVKNCAKAGQHVNYPLGTAVTVYLPGGELSGPSVRVKGAAQPLKGCLLDNAFMPDDPLVAGTTYVGTATWTPTPATGPRTVSWEFTTAGTKPVVPCAATLTSPRKMRRGRAVTLRFKHCVGAAVRATIRREKPHANPLVVRKVTLRSSSLRVPTRKLKPGRYLVLIQTRQLTKSWIITVRR